MKTALFALLSLALCGNLVASGASVQAVRAPGFASLRSRRTRQEDGDDTGPVLVAKIEKTEAPAQPVQRSRMFKCDSELDAFAAAKVNADRIPKAIVARVADTGSMEPALDKNTFVVVARTSAEDIQVGDILVFKRESGTEVIHRVCEKIGKHRFRMKGDNNAVPDVETIHKQQVLGRVVLAFRY